MAKRPVQSRIKRTQDGDEPSQQLDQAADQSFGTDNQSLSMGSEPSEEDIRVRAYQKYLERGGDHGRHFEDWVEAETELKTNRK
jgi:hypothetical protein